MRHGDALCASIAATLGFVLSACGQGDSSHGLSSNGGSNAAGASTGGASTTGGVTSTGGASTGGSSTGSATSSGGVSTGGVSTGGVSTGGVSTGGVSTGGTGGSSTGGASTGGTSTGGGATGGSSTGGTSTGGSSTGGTSTGGSSTGGTSTGGSATGGSSTGGTTGSTGCGATSWPKPSSGNNATYTIDVSGTSREYIVGLPSGYASSQRYPLVFTWHGRRGTDAQVASGGTFPGELYSGYYGLRYQAEHGGPKMIFVSGQGLGTDTDPTDTGWPNTNGRDVAFARAMLAQLEQDYCVDTDRVFSVGMSYGGIMSNTVGCAMGDVIRAIAPMSGAGPGGYIGGLGNNPKCTGQVATWIAHGTNDTTLPISYGQASRDFWLAANHCGTTTQAVSPAPCVAYDGCDSGYPVTWCAFDGVHEIQSFEPLGIFAFLKQF